MTVIMSEEIFIFELLIDFVLRAPPINIFILKNYTTSSNENDLAGKKVKSTTFSLLYITYIITTEVKYNFLNGKRMSLIALYKNQFK